jgi:hypothetical protein
MKMIGCHYWTAIYHGDKRTVISALREIIKKKKLGLDLDYELPRGKDINKLIDTLICDYAPKPIFEGWVDLERPYSDRGYCEEMTNYCVVLDPKRHCTFYAQQAEQYL